MSFLTVYEVAERLKVNQQTVRNWIDSGSAENRLPARARPRRRPRAVHLASSTAKTPDEPTARESFDAALADVQAATNQDQLVPALRHLSRTAITLARVISRH
jgi:excisionase family DNA binding protein